MKAIIFLLIFLNFNLHAQKVSGRITYTVSMKPFSKEFIDTLASKNKDKRLSDLTKSVFNNIVDVNALLEFTSEESMYFLEDKMEGDNEISFNMNRIFAGDDSKYYKNLLTNEYFYESSLFDELELIEIEPKTWEITQETKSIGGFLCYKAINVNSGNTKMNPIAWFTPQIPVGFGPKNFSGLPGLVLELETSKNKFIATQIILNPAQEIKIKKPNKGKKVTAKEIRERSRAFFGDLKKIKN